LFIIERMTKTVEKKRIGLVLASIHTGISRNAWSSFVYTAVAENTSLFIFPGGRINARQDYENLRNPVYYLVNKENLDGCISWSSTVCYTQSKEEFEHFHTNFDPLPFVTFGYKISGHPCIEFDAYNGMKDLVSHCIKVHGGRKIAFLRGPGYHPSAQSRYEGYHDALKEAGLLPPQEKGQGAFRDPLVTDLFNWDAGQAAAAQLFEERSLIPGRDFDTLIGSSDLMTLEAIRYFEKKGYHIPRDYHAAGFNNSKESRVPESPLSTVHVPHAGLAVESFKMLLGCMGRKKIVCDDVLLPTRLALRESCGCVDFFGSRKERPPAAGKRAGANGQKTGEEQVFALTKMAKEYLSLDPAGVNAFVQPVMYSFIHEAPEKFLSRFEQFLVWFFDSGGDTEDLLHFIDDLGYSGLVGAEKFLPMESALYRIIFKIREQFNAHADYEKEQWSSALNSLKCDLLGTRSRGSLVQALARHLPRIGINTGTIVLYADEKTSICVGSFSSQGIGPAKELRFPARLLVPPAIQQHYADGIFMVQPLFIENQSLGYFVHNVPFDDGMIFEELRSAVSYALKGITLLEEAVQAKRIAEQAELAKTEFLQTLENGFHDPLQGIMARIEKLDQKMQSAKAGELAKAVAELKSFVLAKETDTDIFMDFALSRIDELDLKKTLFNPEELLPGIGTFPLLLGDTARLAQCFSLIREQYSDENPSGVNYRASLSYRGLCISFKGKARNLKSEKARQFSLLLAKRIILMHGGEFTLKQDQCALTLPWTTLSGQEPSGRSVNPQDHILVLSEPAEDFLPPDFFDLPRLYNPAKAPPDRTAFVVWNASDAKTEDLIKVTGLRHKTEFAGVPFLCYGFVPGSGRGNAASLIDVVEYALKSPKRGTILFIGRREPGDSGLDQLFPVEENTEKKKKQEKAGEEISLEKIHIDSMLAFNETVAEVAPSLIVFDTLNTTGAAAVRQHPLTTMVPIIMISDRINTAGEVMSLSQYSRLIICHRAAAVSTEFGARVKALIAGDEILPPHTGVLVKKAILYFGQHAESHISRWKLADTVNVSEDYLTRIFHREMGLSLWDYLSRCRIFLAAELLRRTDDTIRDVAFQTGFQDQAYFCRVFKKIYGVPPGQLRKQ